MQHILHTTWHWICTYWWVVISAIIFDSCFEWFLHKKVMHKIVRIGSFVFDYAFKAHAVKHHGDFKADHTYHAQSIEDAESIPMAWWNWLVLVPIACVPAIIISASFYDWWVTVIFFIVTTTYYVVYESFHWCMHLPLPIRRPIEKTRIFMFLNGYHLLHHKFPNKNYNVVFPFADFCMGTMLLRSPVKFPQPRHPSVPNVQPLDPPRA